MKHRTDSAPPVAVPNVFTTAVTACLTIVASGSHVSQKVDVTVVIVDGAELRNGVVRDSKGRPLGKRQSANATYRAKHPANAKFGKDEIIDQPLIVIDLP